MLDNYGTHKHPEVRQWLAEPANQRITLHSTPTGCSLLNMVETFGTGKLPDPRLTQVVRTHFDLTPFGLREMLDLARPIYQKTASYGHFGRKEPEFTWERTDKAERLAAELKTSRAA